MKTKRRTLITSFVSAVIYLVERDLLCILLPNAGSRGSSVSKDPTDYIELHTNSRYAFTNTVSPTFTIKI